MSIDTAPLLPHALLCVRDAGGLAVDDPSVPPPLLTAPPPLETTTTGREWMAHWQRTLAASETFETINRRVDAFLDDFGDKPLRWASTQIKHRTPFPPTADFGIHGAIRRLQRDYGSRLDALDVAVLGLAVTGDWRHVSPQGEVVLASWDALATAKQWMTDALRPAAERAGSTPK
ncbi:MAG: hypothetical protein QM582_16300 [Micropruina sp.]|uniref:hypothetical protein n=1 Tax=Micropruina sp. TaxID=2737536 RepID=UPI0039E547FB